MSEIAKIYHGHLDHPSPFLKERAELSLEERQNQSRTSRLAEYITGKRLDDPEIIDRLISDHAIIRGKYNLPDRRLLFEDPDSFDKELEKLGSKSKVKFRNNLLGHGRFFAANPFIGAVCFGETNEVVVSMDRASLEKYRRSLLRKEHELIHAIQNAVSSRMPIELQENEAFLAGGNMKVLSESSEMVEVLFRILIGGAVGWWYSHESKKRGETILPVWDNAEFFLDKKDIN